MERYRIPFKDPDNNSFDVKIFMDGYTGEVTELTGAVGAFVVTSHDDDFVYTPVRTSTAVISILDNNLLLDLFSVNTQNSPVKAYRNNELIWSGYITPEQFTQPYKGTKDVISIDCVSAMATLGEIEYIQQTELGFITVFDLLRYLILSAKGGYSKIYIPHVYASSSSNYDARENVFSKITLAEYNFLSSNMKLSEVLEYLVRFFGWSMYDENGSLFFVDHDWSGEYYAYDANLTSYEIIRPNDVLIQDVGFAGSEHTIDILNGYNKVTVTSVNNVFEDVVTNENFDELIPISEYYVENPDGSKRKKFYLWPEEWQLSAYLSDVDGKLVDAKKEDIVVAGSFGYGCVAVKNGTAEADDVNYSWSNIIRYNQRVFNPMDNIFTDDYKILNVKGATAMYHEGAISISAEINFFHFSGKTWQIDDRYCIPAIIRIGKKYWNGSEWINNETRVRIQIGKIGEEATKVMIASTKGIEMPYDGMTGYMIILPDDYVIYGDLEIIFFAPQLPGGSDYYDHKVQGMEIKNLKFNYQRKDFAVNEGEVGDREYENVVNDRFLSKLEDIEFGIGSYNKDGSTYSKVLLGDSFLTDNLYSAIEKTLIRPEEAFIRRVINRYKVTKIKLSQVIKNSIHLNPFTTIYDRTMKSKRFLFLGCEKNYSKGYQTVSIIDNGDRDS